MPVKASEENQHPVNTDCGENRHLNPLPQRNPSRKLQSAEIIHHTEIQIDSEKNRVLLIKMKM